MPRRPSISSFRAFSLDPTAPEPLHRQLYDEIRRAILAGRLAAGSRLPASRELASVTHVSRNTVLSAYEQLLAEGYIQSRAGSGTFVSYTIPDSAVPEPAATSDVPQPHSPRKLSNRGERLAATSFVGVPLMPTANTFRPGLPALDHFPMDIWRRIMDRRLRRASVRMLSYDEPQGYLPLREAIAAHLGAARGARCSASQIMIVNGSQQAIDLVARVLLDEGDEVWLESPGYFAARAAFEAFGARVVPVPVDEQGMEVAKGVERAPHARLAYCTPSHQNPLGVTLSLPRRMALMQWAANNGSWVLEDDNASEYRYSGRPLAALQGIDTSQRVLYAGTFSKVMFSSLRLGYLVLPPDLVKPFVHARELTDRQTPGVIQTVLADFMNEGHFSRHVRRMRTLYASRLDALRDALRKHATGLLELHEAEGGMSRVAMLPDGVDDREAALALAAVNIQALPLSSYVCGEPVRSGLVLGFTGVDEVELENGVRKMSEVLRPLCEAARGA
ncbi:MAG: PLP-dependent aminotransferase family protein [Candidatus Eisenbacteria bacterium]|uniref:PLP-dependent aminotransferase family protein n=1 Tax=Eiseniibacteriota bacterium TaxID=2212470 RepID=A0A933S906_UNCEI|nr:PLP-dependent aminotransferase family protein [Candidatus Eisenbacteria bacterium]